MAWRRGVVTMVVVVVVVVVLAPKWNEQRKNEQGVTWDAGGGSQGRGRIQLMGSTYPVVVVGMTSGRRWIHDL